MNHIPFIFSIGLLLWGWQTNQVLASVVMALVLEFSHITSIRWEIKDKEFNIITDLTSISFLLFSVYQFTDQGVHGIFVILEKLPFIFFPLITTQLYSKKGKVPLGSLFITLRNNKSEINDEYPEQINLSFPYTITCVIAASAGNQRSILFFVFISIFLAYCLYFNRPKRYRLGTWLSVIVFTVMAGYLIQASLRILHGKIEYLAGDFIEQMFWRNRSPDKTNTAIGSIGRLKLSDQIHVRVKTEKRTTGPVLLHEAAYSVFSYGVWRNNSSVFTVIDPELNSHEWNISNAPDKFEKMRISAKLYNEKGVVPAPNGVFRINNITAIEIDRNNLGTIRLENREGWNTFDTYYNNTPYADSQPLSDDLEIHDIYKPVIKKVSTELMLASKTPGQAVTAIKEYFRDNYRYSLIQRYRFKGNNRFEDFLLNSHQGHCEYFATATVLLLRSAGIPSRYNVGYSVQEFSNLENQHVARARDAHSWATAFINGQWHIVDTTPPDWIGIDAGGEPWWITFTDIYSWMQFRLSEWRNGSGDNRQLLWFALAIFLFYLLWRLRTVKSGRNIFAFPGRKKREKKNPDSMINTLLETIEKIYPARLKGETVINWFSRIGLFPGNRELGQILKLYYRHRFDPVGLTGRELKILEQKISLFVLQTDLPENK